MTGAPETRVDRVSAAGEVRIFVKEPGREVWPLQQILTRPQGDSFGTRFGTGIALKGDTAWISAPWEEPAGKIHEYRRDSLTLQWAPTGRSVASTGSTRSDEYGTLMDFNGTHLAVGMPFLGNQTAAGTVDLFDTSTLTVQTIREAQPKAFANFGRIRALGQDGLDVRAGVGILDFVDDGQDFLARQCIGYEDREFFIAADAFGTGAKSLDLDFV